MTSGGNNFSRNFHDQSDFPALSRSWNFKEKKFQDFPGGVGTVKEVAR